MAFYTHIPRVRPNMTGRRVNRIRFVTPLPERRAPFTHVPFAPLGQRADLISLEEAQKTAHIVYHSIAAIDRPEGYAFSLVPLSIAAQREDIVRREEGFEMQERKVWI